MSQSESSIVRTINAREGHRKERPAQRRIAVFTRWLEGGGAERVAVNLANTFVAEGFHVDLVLQYHQGPYVPDIDDRIEIIALNRRIRFGLWPLVRYLRNRRPEALLSLLTEPNVLAILAWRLSRLSGRVVVSEQTSLVEAHWTRRFAVRATYKWADRAVACSSALEGELTQLGVPRPLAAFIPNPVSSAVIARPLANSVMSRTRPLIVGTGRLDPQKDFATLIRAFAAVRERRDAELCILGEGEERQRLEALVAELDLAEAVSLPGFVSPPWDIMSQASVFVLSSRWEGWPNVLIEALGLGIPVVSTDCPTGPEEILENGRYGVLVPVGDVSAMAKGILRALGEHHDPRMLRRRSKEWTVASVAQQYLAELGLQAAPGRAQRGRGD